MWLILSFLLFVGVACRERLDPLVQTAQGLIRGQRAEDGGHYEFLGIPYGKVDEKNLFGAASPHPSFDDIFEANDDSSICPQVDESTDEAIGTLDCLHLHIHVPAKASSRNRLPVIVYIHGGSYNVGHASSHGPKHLIKHDVIVVLINYRLGPYGFLCLGTPEVPGNQGIKDQLLALRWVKDNIAAFGGDSSQVTLMGQSAGARSVELHLLSNQEKLFSKAIIQSGTTLRPGNIMHTDVSPALKLADKLGFPTENFTEALDFLVNADPNLIVAAYSQLSLNLKVCIEKRIDNVESIITEHPIYLDIPKIKAMPILVGYNSREALSTDQSKPTDYFKSTNYFRDTLQVTFNVDEDFQEYVDIVRSFYIGDDELTEEVRPDIIDFESDFDFVYPIQRIIKKYLERNPENVFQYLFSYEGGMNLAKIKKNITLAGAAHGDELGYLFEISDEEGTPSDEDLLTINRITTLWTNFAKYGNPTPEITELLPTKWLPIGNHTLNYLNVDSELSMKTKPFKDRLAFWELFFKANQEKLKWFNKS